MHFFKAAKTCVLVLIFLFFSANILHAQGNRGNDTSYYVFFPESITGRFYFSQKYTALTIKDKSAGNLQYNPNTTLNMGVGATYHNFSLNLAYGWPFLNTDDAKGKTKYLDLQGHFYTPQWVTDFYGQFYKGYHLTPEAHDWPFVPAEAKADNYYYRHDAKINLFGLSEYRVFNDKKFSFRAAMIQNEWQKKSAGTFLLGAEAYYGIMKADSAWVPKAVEDGYGQQGINKINYFSIGPGAGYAYTLVMLQHLFVTASLTGNLAFSFTNEHAGDIKNSHFSINPVTRFHVAAGYNSRNWDVSVNWIADDLPMAGSNGNKYALSTGNYRFIIAKRFASGPKLQKHLKPVAAVFKE